MKFHWNNEIKEKLLTLDEDKNALFQLWEERRILYEQCMDLQLFYRDTEQADSYLDPTNMNGKVQKHQNFEQELHANKPRIDEVLDSGIELKESGHV